MEIAGHFFTLRTSDPERLEKATTWLNGRLKRHLKNHAMLKPSEAYLLLLLELSFEREDFEATGKALLKQTDHLLEWINHQLR